MATFPPIVFFLCMAASFLCTVLLFRGWLRSRLKLLLWTSIGFVFLAANNMFVFLDLVVFLDIDFVPYRQVTALAAIAVLLWGFIWEAE